MTGSDYGLTNLSRVLIPTVIWCDLVTDVHTDSIINRINACSCGCDGTSGTVAVILVISQLFGAHYFCQSKENRWEAYWGNQKTSFPR